MADPEQVAAVTRFALHDLGARNAQHDFEHLCRHVARGRIAANVLPATGPVSAHGDQSRDFESYATHLPRGLPGTSVFATGTTQQLVFACTTQQKGLERKVKDDIDGIVEPGPPDEIHYFCTQPVNVGLRHKLQAWAKDTYDVALEIHDIHALGQHLADADLFWVAERYLNIPAELRPDQDNTPGPPDWSVEPRERWRDLEQLPATPSISPWWAATTAAFAFVVGFLVVVGRAPGPVFFMTSVLAVGLGAIHEVLALRRRDTADKWRRVARASVAVALVMSAVGVVFADTGGASGDPLRATAEYQWSDQGDGLTYAMADAPSAAQVARIERARGVNQVEAALDESPAVRVGGVFEGERVTTAFTRVRVTLRGNREEPVLIEGIRAEADCGTPLDGTLFYGPPQGVEPGPDPSPGAAPSVGLAFDLDADDPIAREPDSGGLPSDRSYMAGHFITLARDEPLVLVVRGYTASQHCSWEIQLDIQGEDRAQTIRSADGHPFETTSIGQVPYASTYVLDHLGSMAFVEGPLPDYVNPG